MGPSRRLLLNQSTRLRVAYFQILDIASWARAAMSSALERERPPSYSTMAALPNQNSRVQAVMDGNGLGLWNDLVTPEFGDGALVRLSEVKVENAGYFVVISKQSSSQGTHAFLDWFREESNHAECPPSKSGPRRKRSTIDSMSICIWFAENRW